MNSAGVYTRFGILLLFTYAAPAQTGCGIQHTEPGVFICYPNPIANPEDASVPDVFHLSAQGNASKGHTISQYLVQIDGRRVYEIRLAVPLQQLSIETNLKSPFSAGSHTLRLVIDGAGEAEISGLGFHAATNVGFCDPFNRFGARTCSVSNSRGPLQWPANERPGGASPDRAADPFDGYVDQVKLFGENLKSVEADIGDAVATDAQGNLYMASHSLADVELRKYARNGSLIYANLVRSCGGDGFVAIAAMVIDKMGRAWIAGNTNTCLPTTSNAFAAQTGEHAGPRGFVVMIDTSKPSSAPVYVTYLSQVENRIRALRVDSEGNAYVTGTTASAQFPHESTFSIGKGYEVARGARIGFVSVLNASGSALRWSALFQGAQLNALALDGLGNVYVTGRAVSRRTRAVSGEVLVAALSDSGRRLSYVARFGGHGAAEGRAISTSASGNWVLVVGETESAGFPVGTAKTAQREVPQSFAIALQPCTTGSMYSRLFAARDAGSSPEIAIPLALDAFTSAFPEELARPRASVDQKKPFASVQAAPKCTVPTPKL